VNGQTVQVMALPSGEPRKARLIAPAIVRKLDPTLPGVSESLLELESIQLPRFQIGFPPQRLTMTLLGEFWAGRAEALPSGALVRLLGAFDINEQAARVALGRLASRGALVMERRGRTTWYRASPNLLTLLPQGRAITQGFAEPRVGWDGKWSVVAWSVAGGSSASAHRIRTSLRELGFAPLSPGIWVSPDKPSAELQPVFDGEGTTFTVFVAQEAAVPGAVPPSSAWDPSEIRPEYEDFLAMFRPALGAHVDETDHGAAALVMRTRAVYRWFVIATLDPDLPVELLPADWPRAAARRVFVELVDQLTPFADQHVRSVVGEFAPDLAALVTLPPSYDQC
jgi:phenylacetic acid degradation operon negative regulatory protein